MELQDELLTVAELAITIAGFAAVVTAFTTRGSLHANDIARFRILILCAGVAAALAFVPSLLFSLGYSGAGLWGTASAVMVVVALVSWAASRMQGRGEPSGSPAAMLAVASLGIFNLVLQVANATGLIWTPGGAAYLAGILIWLAVTVAFFVVIVVYRPAA